MIVLRRRKSPWEKIQAHARRRRVLWWVPLTVVGAAMVTTMIGMAWTAAIDAPVGVIKGWVIASLAIWFPLFVVGVIAVTKDSR